MLLLVGAGIVVAWFAFRRSKADYAELADLRHDKFNERLAQREAQVKAAVMEKWKESRYHERRAKVLDVELEDLAERMKETEDAYIKKVQSINNIRNWRDLQPVAAGDDGDGDGGPVPADGDPAVPGSGAE